MNEASHCTTVQLVRSATVRVALGGVSFLIDPMLSEKESWPGFAGTVMSEARNPMRALPMPVEEVLAGVDAVILTHLHEDHWDEAARRALPKTMTIFVNDAAAAEAVRAAGFPDVRVLTPGTVFRGISLSPMLSQHGTDEMLAHPVLGSVIGTTMGVLFECAGWRSVYVAGDTVWKSFVSEQIARHAPDVIVLNTGNAIVTEFPESIIMGARDFLRAYEEAPAAAVVAVHMDAINHCVLRRRDLRDFAAMHGMDPRRALIPEDGEVLRFAA